MRDHDPDRTVLELVFLLLALSVAVEVAVVRGASLPMGSESFATAAF